MSDGAFKRIVWATDGSAAADEALGLVRTLSSESGAALLVFHCDELMRPGKTAGRFPVNPEEGEVKRKIERQVEDLAEAGIDATFRTVSSPAGHAAHAIADAAAQEQADVIVVGTRGQNPLAGLLLGGVTQRLLHIAPCPVLAVPLRRNEHR